MPSVNNYGETLVKIYQLLRFWRRQQSWW